MSADHLETSYPHESAKGQKNNSFFEKKVGKKEG